MLWNIHVLCYTILFLNWHITEINYLNFIYQVIRIFKNVSISIIKFHLNLSLLQWISLSINKIMNIVDY